jgi:hypothetical protein
MPISCNFIEKYRGKKIQKDSKMGTKKIHDTFTHHTIPHYVSEFFISVATWLHSNFLHCRNFSPFLAMQTFFWPQLHSLLHVPSTPTQFCVVIDRQIVLP